jgi:hypothetical protein
MKQQLFIELKLVLDVAVDMLPTLKTLHANTRASDHTEASKQANKQTETI